MVATASTFCAALVYVAWESELLGFAALGGWVKFPPLTMRWLMSARRGACWTMRYRNMMSDFQRPWSRPREVSTPPHIIANAPDGRADRADTWSGVRPYGSPWSDTVALSTLVIWEAVTTNHWLLILWAQRGRSADAAFARR